MRPGEPLPNDLRDALLIAGDGGAATLGERTATRPTLVVLLRHFGCIGCAEQVRDILPRLRELEALEIGVLFVGSGPPEHIAAWSARNDVAGQRATVVTDPTLAAFRAAGLGRSFWATYGPRALAGFLRALSRGHRPFATDGDLYQQGGALLIADGLVVWSQVSANLGDHADPSDAVEVALGLVAARSGALV